ncbi:RNA polymerase III subunit Rpc25, partial [Cooperia oncophora]
FLPSLHLSFSIPTTKATEVERPSDMYDVRRFAAHNLALIYRASGNDYLARRIYEKFLVFRLVVFRPHVDEVIQARVVSSNSLGLTLSTEFFEDITIPAERLPEPHVFEQSEQIWYWEYPSEDGEPPAKLYMDPGKTVRFRVVENIFR